MNKKWIAALLGTATLMGLCGCSNTPDTMVYVQNVGEITGAGSIGMKERFAGVVVSEQETQIQRNADQKVKELYVAVGDSVNKGDLLFEYDSESIDVQLSKKQLELDRLKNNSTTLASEITQLKKEQKDAPESEQIKYTIEISDREAAKKENDYNMKVQEQEISRLKGTLSNIRVISPVSGRIASINESGTDANGQEKAYITIQKSGDYRVKGTINEMNLGEVVEGTPMKVISRTDSEQTWTGTVSEVDLQSVMGDNNGGMVDSRFIDMGFGGGQNEMSTSTDYPFYVNLTDSTGLMLGQHVYLEIGSEELPTGEGLWLPEYYLCQEEAEDGTISHYVWAADEKELLEKRYVTLGAYEENLMVHEIVEGLTIEDYIAFPDETCAVGIGTTKDQSQAIQNTETTEETGMIGESGVTDDLMDPEVLPEGESGGQSMPEESQQNGADKTPTEPVSAPTEAKPNSNSTPATPQPTTAVGSDGNLVSYSSSSSSQVSSDGNLEG